MSSARKACTGSGDGGPSGRCQASKCPFSSLMVHPLLQRPKHLQRPATVRSLWRRRGPVTPLTLAERHWSRTLRLWGLRAVGPGMTGEDPCLPCPGVLISFVWLDPAEWRPRALSCLHVTEQLSATGAQPSVQSSPQGHLQTQLSKTSRALFQINYLPDSSPMTGPSFLPQAENNRH